MMKISRWLNLLVKSSMDSMFKIASWMFKWEKTNSNLDWLFNRAEPIKDLNRLFRSYFSENADIFLNLVKAAEPLKVIP